MLDKVNAAIETLNELSHCHFTQIQDEEGRLIVMTDYPQEFYLLGKKINAIDPEFELTEL